MPCSVKSCHAVDPLEPDFESSADSVIVIGIRNVSDVHTEYVVFLGSSKLSLSLLVLYDGCGLVVVYGVG